MLFKIETQDMMASESYLFGTLHVNKFAQQIGQEICLLPKKVKDAYEKARCYAFEADVTKNTDIAQIIDTWFQKTEHTNPGWFEVFVSQVSNIGFVGEAKKADIENLKKILRGTTPIFFLNHLLQKTNTDSLKALEMEMAPVLDVLLMEQAKSSGKPIHYIETLEEQFDMYFGCGQPLEDHLAAYQHCIQFLQEKNQIVDDTDFLKESYLNQNLDALTKVRHPFAQIQPQIPALTTYLNNMMQVRDNKMAKFREFARGNVFMAVGVLHLPGVIQCLRQQGYLVTQVELGERCYSINPWKLEVISPEMQNFLNSFDSEIPLFFASDRCMKPNLNCLRQAGWTNSIFGELGIDALRTLLIQPTHIVEQFLHNEAGEQRFKPEEILQLEPKVRNTAFACLPNLIVFLEAGISPANMKLLGVKKLKSWLETSDRHLKLVLRMVSWQEILVQDDHKKLIETCYAASYTNISYSKFNFLDKSIQADCRENLNGLQVIFKCGITWPIFNVMSKSLRKAFLSHPEASKELLKLVKQHHFSLMELIKDTRLAVYLNHSPESFILPKLAQGLVDRICQQDSKFDLSL